MLIVGCLLRLAATRAALYGPPGIEERFSLGPQPWIRDTHRFFRCSTQLALPKLDLLLRNPPLSLFGEGAVYFYEIFFPKNASFLHPS